MFLFFFFVSEGIHACLWLWFYVLMNMTPYTTSTTFCFPFLMLQTFMTSFSVTFVHSNWKVEGINEEKSERNERQLKPDHSETTTWRLKWKPFRKKDKAKKRDNKRPKKMRRKNPEENEKKRKNMRRLFEMTETAEQTPQWRRWRRRFVFIFIRISISVSLCGMHIWYL